MHKSHLRGTNFFNLLLVSTRTTAPVCVCVFIMDDGASVSRGESDQQLLSDPEDGFDGSDVPDEPVPDTTTSALLVLSGSKPQGP